MQALEDSAPPSATILIYVKDPFGRAVERIGEIKFHTCDAEHYAQTFLNALARHHPEFGYCAWAVDERPAIVDLKPEGHF